MQRVYASLPLSGPSAAPGRDVLLGAEGIAVPGFARDLEPVVAERTHLFVAQVGPLALYGIQAMDHVLDAIAEGGSDRAAVVRAGRGTRERSSVLGPDTLDDDGLTTTNAYGRLAVIDRQLVWDLTPDDQPRAS